MYEDSHPAHSLNEVEALLRLAWVEQPIGQDEQGREPGRGHCGLIGYEVIARFLGFFSGLLMVDRNLDLTKVGSLEKKNILPVVRRQWRQLYH